MFSAERQGAQMSKIQMTA